jgi:hypothetical protein
MAKTGAQIFTKYRKNLSNAQSDMRLGAETTSKDQAKNAIAQKALMIENHRKAIDRGDWDKGLQASGHAGWQKGYIEKGLPKIMLGVDTAQTKITAAMDKVAQVGEQVQREVATMPKGGIENAVSRVRRTIEITKKAYGKD